MITQLLFVLSFFILSNPAPKFLLVETEGDEGGQEDEGEAADIHRYQSVVVVVE